MAYCRRLLQERGIKSTLQLRNAGNGNMESVAGCVIVRQMPASAKGFMFMTLEDETGTARVIITPDFYHENQMTIVKEKFVVVSGVVQNQDNTLHLRARSVRPLALSAPSAPSRDFH
jgi:error-prone DNA polymerase